VEYYNSILVVVGWDTSPLIHVWSFKFRVYCYSGAGLSMFVVGS
jgi:hypothetical protein